MNPRGIKAEQANDVLVGFCHNGSVATCFMNSLLAAFSDDASRPKRRLVEYHDAAGPYIHDNRARIARYFIDHTDFQWLWMLDNDMQFPPDTLHQMLKSAEEFDTRILGAAYWNQYPGTPAYLSWLQFTPNGIKAIQTLPAWDKPVSVTAVGMGCTLLHRSVLEDVADANPNDPWDTFGADNLLKFEDGGFLAAPSVEDFQPMLEDPKNKGRKVASIDRMGEDVTFCTRALRAGYTTYGLPTIVVEHYKSHFVEHGQREVDGRKLIAVR